MDKRKSYCYTLHTKHITYQCNLKCLKDLLSENLEVDKLTSDVKRKFMTGEKVNDYSNSGLLCTITAQVSTAEEKSSQRLFQVFCRKLDKPAKN